MHILVTRPPHQAAGTKAALERLGHSCATQPLLEIEALDSPLPSEPFEGIILTSSNAAHALADLVKQGGRTDIPVLTTGKSSAQSVKKIGMTKVEFIEGSAIDLAASVPDWLTRNGLAPNLIYPCAESPAHDLTALLSNSHVRCAQWPVYRSVPVRKFVAETILALQTDKIDAVLLYSRRTAHTFVQLMQHNAISMKKLRAFVMSQDIFNALPEDLQVNTLYPSVPAEADLLALIEE